MSRRRSHKNENRERDKKKEPVSQNNDFDLASLLNMLTENLGGMEDIAKIITGEGFKEEKEQPVESEVTEFQTVGQVTDTDYEEVKAEEEDSHIVEQILEDTNREDEQQETDEKFEAENNVVSYSDAGHTVHSLIKADTDISKGESVKIEEKNGTKEPELLSRARLQLCFDAVVRLPEEALECKTTIRNVYLNSCHISVSRNRISLKGYIEENLEYTVAERIKTNIICSTVKDTRIRIPFECTTSLRCTDIAECYENSRVIPLEASEHYDKFKENIERLYYRVFDSEINEYDELINKKAVEDTKCRVYTFEKIKRKIIWTIKLSLWKK